MANSQLSSSDEGLHCRRPGKEPVGEPSAIPMVPLSANNHISGIDSSWDISEIIRSAGLDNLDSQSGVDGNDSEEVGSLWRIFPLSRMRPTFGNDRGWYSINPTTNQFHPHLMH